MTRRPRREKRKDSMLGPTIMVLVFCAFVFGMFLWTFVNLGRGQ